MLRTAVIIAFFMVVHASTAISQSLPTPIIDSSILRKPDHFLLSGVQSTVWKHRKSIEDLPPAHPFGIAMELSWQTSGNKEWHHLHNRPRYGLQIVYQNLDNPSLLGHSVHIFPFLDLFLVRKPRNTVSVKIGTGLGLYTKYYDEKTNPNNVLVGTPVLMTGHLSFNYAYQLSQRFAITTALCFNHASSGSLRQPNLGINMPGFMAGIRYTPRTLAINQIYSIVPYKKRIHVYANLSFSLKESPSRPMTGVQHPAYTLSSYIGYRFSRKGLFLFGFDACQDYSLKYELRDNSDFIAGKYPITRAAITTGYELLLTNRLNILLQQSFYLYNPYRVSIPFYQRLGFKYKVFTNLYLGYYLKTHLGQADFWEFAIGVSI